jgi:hypothetical protein
LTFQLVCRQLLLGYAVNKNDFGHGKPVSGELLATLIHSQPIPQCEANPLGRANHTQLGSIIKRFSRSRLALNV